MSVVGIDLGTTNTVIAAVRSGKVHVLADEQGHRLLPSVVSFHPNGEILVGAAARARRVIDPKNTVYSHKRLLGRSWGSPEIAQARQRYSFELREGPGQGPLVHARGADYTLPEMSAFVLKRGRQIAETALGENVDRAVITVPAHFNELQRASTKVAGRVAGLEVLRILNEPTAAALAYGVGQQGSERVAVYDFGGGTFDCTLLDLHGNVIEVLATAGDPFLGGDDIDELIAERMAEEYLRTYRADPKTSSEMFERLKTAAEELKIKLSMAPEHTVLLNDFGHGLGGSRVHYKFTMTRADLEALAAALVDRTFHVTEDALSLARLSPTSFDRVILVGGTTRIPLVRQRVEAFFGTPPLDRIHPDEVVAMGAAIQAAALTESVRKRNIPAPPPVPRGRAPSKRPPALPSGTAAPSPTSFAETQPRPAMGPSLAETSGSTATAPRTQPLGAYSERGEEPSIASFPDLRIPTPFEWGPGLGGQAHVPDRTVGGNTITQAHADPPTMQAVLPAPSEPAPFELPSAESVAVTVPDPTGEREAPTFGTVGDLSFVSASTESGSSDAITRARQTALEDGTFDDENGDLPTAAFSAEIPMTPWPSPGPPAAPPQSRAVGAMVGKPPPAVAPQPFAPMARAEEPLDSVDETASAPPRTEAMPQRPPPPFAATMKSAARPPGVPDAMPPPARPAPFAATMQSAGQPRPFATTAPLGPPPPPPPPPGPPPPPPFGSAPPQLAPAFGSAPPPAHPSTAPAYGVPPPPGAFGSAPPLAHAGYGSVPPQLAAAPSFSSAPPAPQMVFAAPILVDVTPRALVVETAGGFTDTIIARNSKIPCERTRRFATGRDMQSVVRVRVAQGEHPSFAQNTYLGEVELTGLRGGPRGSVVVAVTFEVDADGTLRVRARDVQTGQEARVALQLIGIADESSVVMMINRFAQQPAFGGPGSPQ